MERSEWWGTTKYRGLSVGPLIAIAPKQASKQGVGSSSLPGRAIFLVYSQRVAAIAFPPLALH
jgi:hypothetical protein